MSDSPLSVLIQHTYVRYDLIYRISLLSEFFDFIFFTENISTMDENAVERFSSNRKEPQKDLDFLKSLSSTFMNMFTRDSFHDVVHAMSDELQRLPILSIIVPVAFSSEHMEAIGRWARETISSNIMLDISVDKNVYIGCRFVWKNIMHDFSIEHYFNLHKDELSSKLSPPISIVAQT